MKNPVRFLASKTSLRVSIAMLAAGFTAVLLASCAAAVSTEGVRVRLGPSGANEAIADMDAGAEARGAPPDVGFDWGNLFDIAGKVVIGLGGLGATGYVAHKGIGLSASKTKWTETEKQDIKDLAAGKPVA